MHKGGRKTGFSHCTKVVPVKSHNEFFETFGQEKSCVISQEPFCEVKTHFHHDVSTHNWLCDRRVTGTVIPVVLLFSVSSQSKLLHISHLTGRERSHRS